MEYIVENIAIIKDISLEWIDLILKNKVDVTNFIQLVSPQLVDWFLQPKLHWKSPKWGLSVYI